MNTVKALMRTTFSSGSRNSISCVPEQNIKMAVSPKQLAALAEAWWIELVEAITTAAPVSLVVTEVIMIVLYNGRSKWKEGKGCYVPPEE